MTFAIGGVQLALRWTAGRIQQWPDPLLYQDFATAPSDLDQAPQPDVLLDVRCGAVPEPAGRLVFDGTDNHWRLYETAHDVIIEVLDVRSRRPRLLARLDHRLSRGTVFTEPEPETTDAWSLRQLMRPLAELLVIRHLEGRGLLIHAAAVADRGRGRVFVGHSGAGKTTMIERWCGRDGVTVLNDERVVIRKTDNGYRVSGTPWCGSWLDLSSLDVPLDALYLIEHATGNAFLGGPSAAFARDVFAQAFVPLWDAAALSRSLAVCEDLVSSVTSQRLGFVNDARIVDFLRADGAEREGATS